MTNLRKKVTLLGCLFIISIPGVQAADGSLIFKGKITNSACTITTPNIVHEGYKNTSRWTTSEQWISPSAGTFAEIIELNCGSITAIPKVRFIAETGLITGPVSGKQFLATTGSASNIAFDIRWVGKNKPVNAPDTSLVYDGTLYEPSVKDAANGIYQLSFNYRLTGLKPYDDSNNGDFESILGYELVYN